MDNENNRKLDLAEKFVVFLLVFAFVYFGLHVIFALIR